MVTGAHGSPPLGSAARDATAAPWHGKHRAPEIASGRNGCAGACGVGCSCGDCPNCAVPGDAPYFPGGKSHREDRVRDQNGDHDA